MCIKNSDTDTDTDTDTLTEEPVLPISRKPECRRLFFFSQKGKKEVPMTAITGASFFGKKGTKKRKKKKKWHL
jgi:hypothetical protein